MSSSLNLPNADELGNSLTRSISEAIEVPITLSDKDIDDVSDEEFMIHAEDSEVWDEYLPSLRLSKVEGDAGGDDLTSLPRYLRQNGRSIDHLRELLREAKSSHLLEYDYYIDGMISLCSLILEGSVPHRHSTRKRKSPE